MSLPFYRVIREKRSDNILNINTILIIFSILFLTVPCRRGHTAPTGGSTPSGGWGLVLLIQRVLVLTGLPPQTNPRYDLSKLTKEEWEEYKRMKRKALIGPDER